MAYKKRTKKKKISNIDTVVVNVKSSFNNTIVSIATMEGDIISRSSAGQLGYKGSRKSTPFAATQVASNLAKDLHASGVRYAEINMQGPGVGRDSVVRAFCSSGITIRTLRDVTPIPFNGCRPPKRRRA